MKKLLSIALLSLLFLVLAFNLVQAEDQPWCSELSDEEKSGGLVPCGRPCDDPTTVEDETVPCTLCHFFMMLDRIIDFLLFVVIPAAAALMIAIGGFMLIFAYTGQGGPEALSRAKQLFTSVVIGLVIVYSAWIIVNTFFMFIGIAEWTGLREGWWQIPCP